MPLPAPILYVHWRRKAASRAALHRAETERLAVVRHPRMLPWPAMTAWQRCAASLSHLRATLFANAAHLLGNALCSFCRHSSILFACTGTPLQRFNISWPQASAAFLLCAWAKFKWVAEIKAAKESSDVIAATAQNRKIFSIVPPPSLFTVGAKVSPGQSSKLGVLVSSWTQVLYPLWVKSRHVQRTS